MAGSDIEAICKHASLSAMKRYVSQPRNVAAMSEGFKVLMDDFSYGLRQVSQKTDGGCQTGVMAKER